MTSTATKTVTEVAQEVFDLLNRAVEERGEDYVYERQPGGVCHYRHNRDRFHTDEPGTPGCIIGLILDYIGIVVPGHREGAGAVSVTGDLTDWPADVRYALDYVQTAQDGGKTWGEARDRFQSAMRDEYGIEVTR